MQVGSLGFSSPFSCLEPGKFWRLQRCSAAAKMGTRQVCGTSASYTKQHATNVCPHRLGNYFLSNCDFNFSPTITKTCKYI